MADPLPPSLTPPWPDGGTRPLSLVRPRSAVLDEPLTDRVDLLIEAQPAATPAEWLLLLPLSGGPPGPYQPEPAQARIHPLRPDPAGGHRLTLPWPLPGSGEGLGLQVLLLRQASVLGAGGLLRFWSQVDRTLPGALQRGLAWAAIGSPPLALQEGMPAPAYAALDEAPASGPDAPAPLPADRAPTDEERQALATWCATMPIQPGDPGLLLP